MWLEQIWLELQCFKNFEEKKNVWIIKLTPVKHIKYSQREQIIK